MVFESNHLILNDIPTGSFNQSVFFPQDSIMVQLSVSSANQFNNFTQYLYWCVMDIQLVELKSFQFIFAKFHKLNALLKIVCRTDLCFWRSLFLLPFSSVVCTFCGCHSVEKKTSYLERASLNPIRGKIL